MCCCNKVNEDIWVYGGMFQSEQEYKNPLLKGRFRLKMRGIESLIREEEWDYIPSGGFKVFLTPGWKVNNEVKILVEFY